LLGTPAKKSPPASIFSFHFPPGPVECERNPESGIARFTREKVRMAGTMTKTQLVRLMAENLEITNKQSAAFLENLAEVAVAQTKRIGVFVLPGLGRLKKVQRKARTGRNPQTGEPIKIKAKTTAKFYLAKAAKDAIAPPKK
jgi:DNA-binding protein HU-beta